MTDTIQHTTGHGNQRGHAILSISIACGVLETIAVGLRFLARRKLGAKLRSDDWLILVSLLPNYGMIVTGAFAVSDGKAGNHTMALNHHQLVIFLKVMTGNYFCWAVLMAIQTLFSTMITYIVTVTLVRISVLLLLRRIFDVKPFRIITSVVGAACVAWGVSIFFANLFQCTPLVDAFNPEVVMSLSPKCIDLQAMFYGTLGTAVTLNVIILILPLHLIWRLSLSTRRKFELTAILSLGGISCIASVMRIVAIGDLKQTDLVYTTAASYMWSQIEPSAAILGACIVTFRPLFRDVRLPSFITKNTSTKTETGDVSRRWPSNGDSEKGSEAGLVSNEAWAGQATPENAKRASRPQVLDFPYDGPIDTSKRNWGGMPSFTTMT